MTIALGQLTFAKGDSKRPMKILSLSYQRGELGLFFEDSDLRPELSGRSTPVRRCILVLFIYRARKIAFDYQVHS
jgi:hypothetical protein